MPYFIVNPSKSIPELQTGRLPEKLETALEKKKHDTNAPRWKFIEDCVLRGTMTLLEAESCLKLGYVPKFMQLRKSKYIYRD